MARFGYPVVLLLLLAISGPRTAAADAFDDGEAVSAWVAKMADTREVVDRLVVCFDEASFLQEIAKWDEQRYWPVLLWDSDLVPKFVEAFRPKQRLVPRIGEAATIDLDAALRAIAGAWGAPQDAGPANAAAFLHVLRERKRAPMGAVLLSADSPDLLGGVALAAGRFHLPVVFETKEKRDERLTVERVVEVRKELARTFADLELAFDAKFDELDFVTVACDLPFAYTPSSADAHPGRYTVDDALARQENGTRWAWLGRLTGGPARSVYMAMGALFLQPESGLLWSRYNPKNATFGVFSPAEAKATFDAKFPTQMIEHPDATLARWRELEWPEGNRFGFIYVNSSGGATSWSTSKGKGTHFDVPDTLPTIVHYTHSGSAGSPFNTDTIAGRWLARGAYIYFGSHAEPYLTAFIPPKLLASRVEAGVPLGAAMRHLHTDYLVGQREMKVDGEQKMVRFNMSGPWKLAYFGDPSYRLTGKTPERVAPDKATSGYYRTVKAFIKARPKTDAGQARHALDALGALRIDPSTKKLVDLSGWKKTLKSAPEGERAAAFLREMTRLWVASLVHAGSEKRYDVRALRKLAKLPAPISKLIGEGVEDPEAARCIVEFAKRYVSGLPNHPESGVGQDPAVARWVLVQAARYPQPKGARAQFLTWTVEAGRMLGIAPDDLRAEILAADWVPDAVRKTIEAGIKGKLE